MVLISETVQHKRHIERETRRTGSDERKEKDESKEDKREQDVYPQRRNHEDKRDKRHGNVVETLRSVV